jgi:hypothetical protein
MSGEVGQNNLHRIWEHATGWESHLATGDGEGNIVLARRWMAPNQSVKRYSNRNTVETVEQYRTVL